MLTEVTLRDTKREDVGRIARWLEDEEISSSWFGYAGADPLHRGYDPIRMLEASESEWDGVFRLDPSLFIFSIYRAEEEHIGECQVLVKNKAAEITLLIGRKDLWHQGYGTSAVTSLLDQLFNYYKLDVAWVNIPKTNMAGLGLFTKLGFIHEEDSDNFYRMYRERTTLKEVDIFSDLDYRQVDVVASLGRRIEVPAGHVLGRAGELSDQLYVIIDGKAELSAHSGVGEITVRVAGAGESFPLAALIGSGILITTATAMTDMILLAIPRDDLLALCSEDTDIGLRIYTTIADVLATRYSRTLAHLTHNAEQALQDADFFANV